MRNVLGAAGMIVLFFACAGFAQEGSGAAQKEKAPRFVLMGVDDEPFGMMFPREKVVIMTIADQGGQAPIEEWSGHLEKRYGARIERIRVAWLEAVPKAMHGAVVKIIKDGYPGVLLDWNGATAKRYRCKTSAANVFVLSKDGFILFQYRGEFSQEDLEKAYDVLDAALDPKDK